MSQPTDRIKNLSGGLFALLEKERESNKDSLQKLLDAVKAMQEETGDVRMQRVSGQLKKLQERGELLVQMARQNFLKPLELEAEEIGKCPEDGRLAALLDNLLRIQPATLNSFCHTLIDGVIETTGAERGFLLFYLPESSEAEILAVRNFQTAHFSVGEFEFSRTLLRRVFQTGTSLFIEDASQDPSFARENSVVRLQLKAVLAAPLKQGDRTIGAIYLENNTLPGAFRQEDLKLLEILCRFAVFYLDHARLLPVSFQPERKMVLDAAQASKEIVGRDSKILSLLETVKRIADSPATILVEGESGTGKELIARALHFQSRRKDHPFMAINCAAIPEHLLESELFGYEKGAFTGAGDQYIGRIEQGNGGTLFLDEVSELAHPLQAKLLRFLQSNELNRLGGKHAVQVDIRTIAATSKNLKSMVEEGKFYDALYYRLNVIPLHLPPLREHPRDIPLLVEHFLAKFSKAYGRVVRVEPGVIDCLQEHSFPGNVRELENLIHRLIALATDGSIRLGDLPDEILQMKPRRVRLSDSSAPRLFDHPAASFDELNRQKNEIKNLLAEQELHLVEQAIQEAGGNLTEAARRLGVHRVTLHKMKRRGKATP